MSDQELIAQIDGFDKSLPLIENLKRHIEKMNSDPDCTSSNLSLQDLWDISTREHNASAFALSFHNTQTAIQALAQAAWYHRKQKLATKDQLAHWQCRASRAEAALEVMLQVGGDVLGNKTTIIDGKTMEELPTEVNQSIDIGEANCKGAWELGTACGVCRRCRLTVMEFATTCMKRKKQDSEDDRLAKSIMSVPVCQSCGCSTCMCDIVKKEAAAHVIGESMMGEPSASNFANSPGVAETLAFNAARGLNPDGTVPGHQPEDKRFQ